MNNDQQIIRVTEPKLVTHKFTTNLIQSQQLSTFGYFIKVRARPWRHRTAADKEAKDRRKYGSCVACGNNFRDEDAVHFAQSVHKDGKNIGNLLACSPCALAFNAHSEALPNGTSPAKVQDPMPNQPPQKGEQ